MSLAIHTYSQWTDAAAGRVIHGSFSRRGGVSPPPYNSLNLSYGVGDPAENVAENRLRVRRALGLKSLVSSRQVHGSRIYQLRELPKGELEVDGYDALVTPLSGVGLMIQQADCQAVMLFDSRQKVVANIHVGWRGSVAGIIALVLELLVGEYGSRPAEIEAVISPGLGPCCAEFIHYRQELPPSLHRYRLGANHFDFWAISRDQLLAAGLIPAHIETAGICTCCHPADYFSYRREARCGRNASVIARP